MCNMVQSYAVINTNAVSVYVCVHVIHMIQLPRTFGAAYWQTSFCSFIAGNYVSY